MSGTTNHLNKQKVQTPDVFVSLSNSIPGTKLYLSHLSENNDEGILITSIRGRCKSENRIPLKLDHPDNFGNLQLSYRSPKFQNYFPPNAIIKVSEILLKKSTIIPGSVHDGDWDIIHIATEKESDCHYLFEEAVKNKYTVVLAVLLEIINANNSSRQLVLHPYSDDCTLLRHATAERDMKIIEVLLKYKLDIDTKSETGKELLFVAIDSEMSNVVDILISNGVDVNTQCALNRTPLHYAVKINSFKMLHILLKNQAKLDMKDEYDETPLYYAVEGGNVDAVDILLKNGANYRLTDSCYRTALHLAVYESNLDIIEVFLKNKVNADILNVHGQTPLFYLSKRSHSFQSEAVYKEICLKIINTLIKHGANINSQDLKKRTPLHHAVINDNFEFMQALLECNADVNIQDKFGSNIIHSACWYEANTCIEAILNLNIDIDAVDSKNRTAFNMAIERKNCRAIELILKKDPNIITKKRVGQLVLHLAIESEYLPIIEHLLKNKADVNLKDDFGKTAQHNASKHSNVDVNIRDFRGRSLLHLACLTRNLNIVKCIIESGADSSMRDKDGRTKFRYANIHVLNGKYLFVNKVDINAVDKDLISSLHLACFTKNAKVVKYLIKNGADFNMRDKDGKTVFHYACMEELNGILSCTNSNTKENLQDTLNVLVKEKISIDCVDKFGKTSLHYAAKNNNVLINELLLNVGADINIMDKDHNSPFDEFFIQNNYIRDNTSETLYKKHIVRMKVMKLWVRGKTLDQIYKVDNECYLKWIKYYERVCSREINLMKSTYLDENNITYYDFLKKSPHNAVNFTRNQNIVNAISSDELITKYPIYGHFLKCHLREIQRRSHLYEQIKESLESYIFKMLPIPCMYNIFKYLNNSELNILLEAMKPVVPRN